MRPTSGHKQTIFTKYFVRTGIPRYLGTKQQNYLFTKVTKYGKRKLHSFESEMDAQACNVSYQHVRVLFDTNMNTTRIQESFWGFYL